LKILGAISDLRFFRNVIKIKIIPYQQRAAFLPARNEKSNEKKMAEEYCWAITQAAGQLCCGRFQSVGVWVSAALSCVYSGVC
jgi:hypothetical protein